MAVGTAETGLAVEMAGCGGMVCSVVGIESACGGRVTQALFVWRETRLYHSLKAVHEQFHILRLFFGCKNKRLLE